MPYGIDETLNATNTTSAEVSTKDLIDEAHGYGINVVAIQVSPASTGAYEVRLEGNIHRPDKSDEVWTEVGVLTQADDVKIRTFPAIYWGNWRVVHVSGVSCRVTVRG